MQKFTTPGGETLVLLALKEYDDLVDAADIAAADNVRLDIKAGRDELIPASVANRLLDGENPIRVWREYRRLTARDLAEKSDVSAAYLSELETGKKKGGIGRLAAIAGALGVEIDDLV